MAAAMPTQRSSQGRLGRQRPSPPADLLEFPLNPTARRARGQVLLEGTVSSGGRVPSNASERRSVQKR